MKTWTTILFVFLSIAGIFAEIKTEDDVLVITNANFKDAITEHPYILVEFCEFYCIYFLELKNFFCILCTFVSCCFVLVPKGFLSFSLPHYLIIETIFQLFDFYTSSNYQFILFCFSYLLH